MEKEILSLGQISARFCIAKHVLDYIYSSGKLPTPKLVSGRKIFQKQDIDALEIFLSKEKFKEGNTKNLPEVKNGNETK